MVIIFLGTGKTLSLLCAALAWREAYVAHLQLNSKMKSGSSEFMKDTQETLDLAVGFGISNANQAIPKIIYASRTHSQLSQAVNELKNTSYKPVISVLGSRDQMCINNDVASLEENNAKVFACRVKISSHSCIYYNNLEANINNKEFKNEILDIEDLSALGRKHKVCPYFMSRELRAGADLIFMPYNYVLDSKMRQKNSIDLKNAIILLDEAHNVEKVCEEAASFEVSTSDLANAQADCDECRKMLEERNGMLEEGFDERSSPEYGVTVEDTMKLKEIFNKIEKIVMEPNLTPENSKKVADPQFLFDELKKENIDASSVNAIVDAIDQCNTMLASQATVGIKRKNFALAKIAEVLKTLFCYSDQPRNFNHEVGRLYKVVIRLENAKSSKKSQSDIWDLNPAKGKCKVGRKLSYWCFHAGVSMKEIMKQGARSLILTSGTLSPLESFTSELDIPFPVTLQNPHVIGPNQIWAGIITKGPDGVELNSSYQNRSTPQYQSSLGNLLVNFSRSTPHGLLVFFPSYVLMDEMIKAWSQNGILDRITQSKPHFAEPKDKKSLATQMEMFYENINDPAHKGAIFFAVCRGKVSEGLDFADNNGRVVVITGLPYPPKMDAKVELKMKFLDKNFSRGKISGKQWYSQQASRAVNQAVGRVIRHSKDYGAILLCDVRFTYPDAIARLPIWVKPHVKTYGEFDGAYRNLILFFKNAENMFSPPKAKAKWKHESKQSSSSLPVNESVSAGARKNILKQRISWKQRQKPCLSLPSVTFTNFNSNAAISLAAIKAGELPVVKGSIFESMSESTQKREVGTVQQTSCISAKILGTNNDAMQSKWKARKLKLVSNRCKAGIEKAEDSMKQEGVFKLDDRKANKNVTNARQYIMTMRSVLSKEDYEKFAKIMLNYTKKENMEWLIESLTQFFGEKTDQLYLFKGFENFIKKEKDKEVFHEAYEHLIERIASKKREGEAQNAIIIPTKTKVESDASFKCNQSGFIEPMSKRPKLSVVKKNDKRGTQMNVSEFFPTLSDDDSVDESGTN